MLRYLPFILQIALLIYCLADCSQTDESRIRNLPKWAWVVLIIVLPWVGAIAWLVAGRPRGGGRPGWGGPGAGRAVPPRPLAPDDDPEFLAKLDREAEHQKLLDQWESDLRRREEQLKGEPDHGGPVQDDPPGGRSDRTERPGSSPTEPS